MLASVVGLVWYIDAGDCLDSDAGGQSRSSSSFEFIVWIAFSFIYLLLFGSELSIHNLLLPRHSNFTLMRASAGVRDVSNFTPQQD